MSNENKTNEEKIEFEKEFIEENEFLTQFAEACGFDLKEAEEALEKLRYFKYECDGEYDQEYVNDLLYRLNSPKYGNESIRMTFDQNIGEFMSMEISEQYYSIEGVNFNSMEEYLAIKKNDENYNFEEFKKDFPQGFVTPDKYECNNPFLPHPDEYEEFYNSIEPMTAKEALNRYKDNAEQRMVVFTIMSPAKMLKDVDAELIDSQTLTKKREYTKLKSNEIVDEKKHRALDMYEVEEVEFPDTYELYKVDSEVMGLDKDSGDPEFTYVLTMKDTTTERMYGLFIDPDSQGVEEKDAVLSIAETFQIPSTGGEMRTMTKDEYLNNLKAES